MAESAAPGTTEQMEPDATPLICPLCGSSKFGTYRGRPLSRCAGCGSKERGRFLGLVLQRLAPPPSGAPVYHFAPEQKIAEILLGLYGASYVPADIEPADYRWSKVPVRKIDLRRPLAHIEGPVQGMVHSHVLEHIPASLDRVVGQMNALIEPGGFHALQVPIHRGWYREDMNPEMLPEERERLFYQSDHVRAFGSSDSRERLLGLFEGFEQVDLTRHVTEQELAAAAIPVSALTSLTGHSVFFFRKSADPRPVNDPSSAGEAG